MCAGALSWGKTSGNASAQVGKVAGRYCFLIVMVVERVKSARRGHRMVSVLCVVIALADSVPLNALSPATRVHGLGETVAIS